MENILEEWRPVVGWEGLYEVSNLGNVRRGGKVLKPVMIKSGYTTVMLCRDGKPTRYLIHRLVAEAFIPNPYNFPIINHKNEVKYENYVWNLEWCDYPYNLTYGHASEKRKLALSKPIIQSDKDGIFIKRWPSINECIRAGFFIQYPLKTGKEYKSCRWAYETEYAY